MDPALLLPLLVLAPVLGVGFVKTLDQRARDKQLKTYNVSFPDNLETAEVLNWITAITGTLRAGSVRLVGVPTIVFEVLATERGITHRLRVPGKDAAFIVSQLRQAIRGTVVTPVSKELPEGWSAALELGETNPHRSLRITSPEALSASLLASMQPLDTDEALLMQWVISPKVPERPPAADKYNRTYSTSARVMLGITTADRDEVHDRRDKLSEPNMFGVLRLAAKASTVPKALGIIRRLEMSIASARSADNRFRRLRYKTFSSTLENIRDGRAPMNFPAQLSATELVALIAWPVGNPHVAGLPRGQSRHLPASELVPREGRVVAMSNFPGSERALAVTPEGSTKHFHIVGRTGSGKTTLLLNLLTQDIQRGAPVIVVDPKEDLAIGTLDRVPEDRLDDVIYMSLTDVMSVGFNVLSGGSTQIVASELHAIFKPLYATDGVPVQETLYHGILTLMTSGFGGPYTFVDLVALFWPTSREEKAWSKAVIEAIPDPYIRSFWKSLDGMKGSERERYLAPLRARIWQLNARPEIRYIIGQAKSSFDMTDVLRGRKILILNLHGTSDESASLLGSLILNNLWHAVKRGVCDPKQPAILAMDEFWRFTNLPVSFETMTAEARSFGLSMHLAHQGLDQLTKPGLKSAVMNNVVNKVVFNRGADDAAEFAREFGKLVDADDFKQLGFRQMLTRLVDEDGGVSPPMSALALAPLTHAGLAVKAIQASRTRYGRSAADIESEIQARRTAPVESTRQKKIGEVDWDGSS